MLCTKILTLGHFLWQGLPLLLSGGCGCGLCALLGRLARRGGRPSRSYVLPCSVSLVSLSPLPSCPWLIPLCATPLPTPTPPVANLPRHPRGSFLHSYPAFRQPPRPPPLATCPATSQRASSYSESSVGWGLGAGGPSRLPLAPASTELVPAQNLLSLPPGM